MKKFLIKAILFSACIACIVVALILIPDTELIVGRKKVYLEKNVNKTYDLLILGSTRAQHSFNPELYTGNLNIFNVGEDGHGLPSNYLMLKVLVEKHHLKIRKLLLEVDEFAFRGDKAFSRQFRDDYFVTDLDDPEVFNAFKKYRGEVIAYLLKFFPKSANLFYCEFTRLVKNEAMSFRRIFPSINKMYLDHLEKAAIFKGYVPLIPGDHIKLTNAIYDMQDDDVEYFNKLIAFCKSHHIEVFCYRSPILNCQMVNSAPFDNFMKKFSETSGIKFFDYKCKYQWPGYFEDQSHSAKNLAPYFTKDLLRDVNIIK
jgi:hypothetical protein